MINIENEICAKCCGGDICISCNEYKKSVIYIKPIKCPHCNEWIKSEEIKNKIIIKRRKV